MLGAILYTHNRAETKQKSTPSPSFWSMQWVYNSRDLREKQAFTDHLSKVIIKAISKREIHGREGNIKQQQNLEPRNKSCPC